MQLLINKRFLFCCPTWFFFSWLKLHGYDFQFSCCLLLTFYCIAQWHLSQCLNSCVLRMMFQPSGEKESFPLHSDGISYSSGWHVRILIYVWACKLLVGKYQSVVVEPVCSRKKEVLQLSPVIATVSQMFFPLSLNSGTNSTLVGHLSALSWDEICYKNFQLVEGLLAFCIMIQMWAERVVFWFFLGFFPSWSLALTKPRKR